MNTNVGLTQGFDQTSDASSQYLSFILAEEEYAVDILHVQEIRSWEKVTSIPNTPDYVAGVINLRGVVVPIVDLRRRFGLASTEFGLSTVVVIVTVDGDRGSRVVGLVADAVSDVYRFAPESIGDTPEFGGAIGTDYVKGLVSVNEKLIILLDIDELITVGVFEANTNQLNTEADSFHK